MDDARRRGDPEKVACTWCRAEVGQPCTRAVKWGSNGRTPGTEVRRPIGEYHVARWAALEALGTPCPDCRGRGWYVGDCHPQETCGTCGGQGYVTAEVAARAQERQQRERR